MGGLGPRSLAPRRPWVTAARETLPATLGRLQEGWQGRRHKLPGLFRLVPASRHHPQLPMGRLPPPALTQRTRASVVAQDPRRPQRKGDQDVLFAQRRVVTSEVSNCERYPPGSVETTGRKAAFSEPALEEASRSRAQRRDLGKPRCWQLGVGPQAPLSRPSPCHLDPLGYHEGRLACGWHFSREKRRGIQQLFNLGPTDSHPEVEAVKQRSRDTAHIPRALCRRAPAGTGRTIRTATARVHRRDQKEPSREGHRRARPAHYDPALFEWLAEVVEHRTRELRQLVQK